MVNGGEFLIKSGASTSTVDSSVSVTDGKWHFMSATYDGTTMRIYVDGVQTGSGTSFSGNLPTQSGNVRVGADYQSTPGNFFTGSLDEVRIYNRALSASEIQALYKSGAQKFTAPPTNLGLVGYWSMNEGTGTVAGDGSGNGNRGILTGGPTWVDGKRGKAINFDGGDDYVNAGSAGNFERTNSFTVSLWIKRNPNPTVTEAVVAKAIPAPALVLIVRV